MIGYLVFAVIVLFQSDIRRALAHFGRAPFFRYLIGMVLVDTGGSLLAAGLLHASFNAASLA